MVLSINEGATNESGFTALPGGYIDSVGSYLPAGSEALFWTSNSVNNNNDAVLRICSNYYATFHDTDYSKKSGLSVRCIKD